MSYDIRGIRGTLATGLAGNYGPISPEDPPRAASVPSAEGGKGSSAFPVAFGGVVGSAVLSYLTPYLAGVLALRFKPAPAHFVGGVLLCGIGALAGYGVARSPGGSEDSRFYSMLLGTTGAALAGGLLWLFAHRYGGINFDPKAANWTEGFAPTIAAIGSLAGFGVGHFFDS
ncbi:MAG: hypothetical protein HYY44_02140 [Deltaproteobacteria bacterium]|nr:hypothetical protein [Deltaproteobacteria bacterium]